MTNAERELIAGLHANGEAALRKNGEVPVVELFGIRFSNLTFPRLCDLVASRIEVREPGFFVTPNVDHVVRLTWDAELQDAYRRASAVLADGVPIIWASRLLGDPIVEKLSGSDLLGRLSGFAADAGYRIFLLGAGPGVAEAAAENLLRDYPNLAIGGTYSPPLDFEKDPEQHRETLDVVRAAQPDILFVALGSPKQEIWLCNHSKELGVPVSIGVGAALDFMSGRVKRAPRWVQKCGAEWLWRLCQEPRRLWRRYLLDDSKFIPMVWREFWHKRKPERRLKG